MTTTEKLARIANRSTKYEIAIEKNGNKMLLCYTNQHSGRGLRSVARERCERIVAFAGADMIATSTAKAITIEGGCVVRFTGRTQREAIISGELPFLAEVPTGAQRCSCDANKMCDSCKTIRATFERIQKAEDKRVDQKVPA